MASVDDQEKQSSKSWLRHGVESALIALDRPAGFLVPVGAAVVCIKAVCSFLDALLVYQTENAFLGEWASKFSYCDTGVAPALFCLMHASSCMDAAAPLQYAEGCSMMRCCYVLGSFPT